MLLQKTYSAFLFLFFCQLFCYAQDSLLNKDTKQHIPQTLQLSHIEIQEQFIDFKKLKDPSYRQQLEFGKALSESFDTVVAHFNYPLNLNLPHYLNDLTFYFSAIDWEAPHKIKYSYFLEGFDEGWSEPKKRASVNYLNLKHGEYTLKIKAIGEAQIWSAPFMYSFDIQRPWWRTWWIYTLEMLIILAALYSLFHFWKERKGQEAEIQRLLKAYKLTELPKAFELKKAPEESNFLNLVQTTLETHLSDENFGIAELCELLNISRAQLHRKLKKLTGLSTSHYIRSLRLEIAKNILETSDLNVSEVAFKVGFSSPTYFSKVFKVQFGYPPRELR